MSVTGAGSGAGGPGTAGTRGAVAEPGGSPEGGVSREVPREAGESA